MATFSISKCINLRVTPSAPAANNLLLPQLSTRCQAERFDIRGVDHLRVCQLYGASKLPEQISQDAAPCQAHKAIINRHCGITFERTIAPATAAFQDVRNAANDAAVVHSLVPSHICWQTEFDPISLLII